jgi:uncharacterized membrane protein
MLTVLSALALTASVALAHAAERFGAQRAVLEHCCGLALVAGLSMIGAGLPLYR